MPTKTPVKTPPATPEELDPSSPLGALYRDYRRREAQRDDVSAYPRLMKLRKQRREYEATIAGATPESDMVAIAAAEVGLAIVKRALQPIEREVREWEEETARITDRWTERWSAYRGLLARLAYHAERGDVIGADEADAEARRLIGWPARA